MLDVDKQPDWEDPITGVVSQEASLDCLTPFSDNYFIYPQGLSNGTQNHPIKSTD